MSAARIRRSCPDGPGFRRLRRGRGFEYRDLSGRPIKDVERLTRIKALVIPPAWREVWICPWSNGHIQAVGTDEAGRRQYLYHERFRAQQEQAKHEHVLEFAAGLPDARTRARAKLGGRGLSRDRVLACAVLLLDSGLFRVGSERYAEANGSFGLTTLRCEHVQVRHGGGLEFAFRAKAGREFTVSLHDDDLASTVAALRRGRGGQEHLLVYRSGRVLHEVHSEELNGYLKDLFGLEASAKDFRTWHATLLAAVALAAPERVRARSATARRKAQAAAVREVAEELGNTPAVCRASYINPRVLELFEQGHTIDVRREPERAVLDLLAG